MARMLFSGLETGAVLSEGATVTGTVTFDTTIVRTGARSLRVAPASTTQAGITFGNLGEGYARFYVRFTALPSTNPRSFFGNPASNSVHLMITPSGAVQFRLGLGNVIGTATTTLTDTSRWYRIEVRSKAGSSVPVLRIDGANEVTGSPSGWDMTNRLGSNDVESDTFTAYYDDFSLDDTAFPGDGKVALLVPTAQNSVTASTWQKPGGAVTNMHTSVDNIPPIGVANSTNVAQAENQIRNAVSNATADVVFAMTTYTAAGIGASDTINATQAFALVGLATTATTKTGSLQTTNPAQAEVNFGAYGTGAAVGTFPTNWQRRSHTITQNPTPTLGTAPTVEVGQRTANTTIAQVCHVGMYVDYTPASAPAAMTDPMGMSGFFGT